jgi:spermidine synthase
MGTAGRKDRQLIVERRQTPRGELVLRRAGADFEVIADGTFLMDTRDGRSERLLVREAIAGRDDVRLLIGGLGVGFSLDEALSTAQVSDVVLVEIELVVVEWARTHLRGLNRHGIDDPRVELVVADLLDALDSVEGRFDAICLDTDNGPGWLVHPDNAQIYTDTSLRRLRDLLLPGGRLAVWAAAPDERFEARLRTCFDDIRMTSIPVARGPDDVIYVAQA